MATAVPLMVAGVLIITDWALPSVTEVMGESEISGVVTSKAAPAACTFKVCVVLEVVLPLSSSHSIKMLTMPTAVPVNVRLTLPLLSVDALVELSVPLPVLEAAIEKRRG